MRTPVLVGLLATVVVLAGCSPAESVTTTPSASPSAGPATRQYALTPQVCSQIEFDDLKSAIPLPVAEEEAVNWDMPANFMYTGGIQCRRTYGAGTRPVALVTVGIATYDSPKGARLAYDTRLNKETIEGSLSGVEFMSHAHDASDDILYVNDANLFVEVHVSVIDESRTFTQVGIAENVASTIESFTGSLVERLRVGQ